jgi:type I restriction enzyme S subunit
MNEWKECKLGDVIISNSKSISTEYKFKNIQYLDTGSVTEGKIESFQLFKIEDAPSRAKRLVKANDIVYSTVRPIQRHYGIIKNPPDNLVVSTGFSVIEATPNLADPNFLYHLLSSDDVVEFLDSIAEGSTSAYPSLRPSDIESLPILLPPLAEQKAIAGVLSALDDKIDLLHRQNKTLEAMAEALFRQWFVEEAEEISNKKLDLGDLVESVSKTHELSEPQIIFLNTSDVYKGNVLKHEFEAISALPGQAKKSIVKNDILFSEIRPANGRFAYVDFDAGRYVVSTKLMVLRSKGIISQAFVYFYLSHPYTLEILQLLAESRSGTFPQITFDQIRSLKINIPTDKLFQSVSESCIQWLRKLKFNHNQIRSLEKLRDTLLPKLMSGEVRVNE